MVILSLGSNIEPKIFYLKEAINMLKKRGVFIKKISQVYETEPRDFLNQDMFYNIVIQIDTNVNPYQLLDICQNIEKSLKRKKKILKGPRTIDIDIICFRDYIIDEEILVIPHHAYKQRNFVLIPLGEIIPDFKDPSSSININTLYQECLDDGKVNSIGNLYEI